MRLFWSTKNWASTFWLFNEDIHLSIFDQEILSEIYHKEYKFKSLGKERKGLELRKLNKPKWAPFCTVRVLH
jgi:hypothetical protein